MRPPLPQALHDLAEAQAGAVSLCQIVAVGLTRASLRAQVTAGRWQRVLPRVFVLHSGPIRRRTQIWAVLLYAGVGAVASHETAAELWGLLNRPAGVGDLVHVTVTPAGRVQVQRGVRIHDAARLPTSRHPSVAPPRTRVEDSLLDLADASTHLDAVVGWVTQACQRRRTTTGLLWVALDRRKKIRWREELHAMLSDVASGAESPLELAYLRLVERAHGLPNGERQAHRFASGRSQWTDVRYTAFAMLVELDGRVGHLEDGHVRDHRRDNLDRGRLPHASLRLGRRLREELRGRGTGSAGTPAASPGTFMITGDLRTSPPQVARISRRASSRSRSADPGANAVGMP